MTIKTEINEKVFTTTERDKKLKFYLTVEPAFFAVFFAKFLTGIVLTNLFLVQTCLVILNRNSSMCNLLNSDSGVEKLVQPHASYLLMWKTLLSSVLPAILSLILGPWSDTKGRRPMIIVPLLGCAIMYAIYGALSEVKELHPAYMLLGVLPQALAGGTVGMVSAAYGYISDISAPSDRSFRLGVVEGFILTGLLCGLSSSSFIFNAAGLHGYLTIFMTASAACLLGFFYVCVFVPESVQLTKNSKGLKGLNLNLFNEMIAICCKSRPNHGRLVVFLTIFSLTINSFVTEGILTLEFLYMRLQFGWSYRQYTFYCSFSVILHLLGTIISCWCFSSYLKVPDTPLVVLAFTSSAARYLLMDYANTTIIYLLYVSMFVGLFKQTIPAFLRSILSKSVPSNDVGKVFALASTMEAIAPIAAGPLYTILYNNTIGSAPGSFLILNAILFGLVAVLLGLLGLLKTKAPYEQCEK